MFRRPTVSTRDSATYQTPKVQQILNSDYLRAIRAPAINPYQGGAFDQAQPINPGGAFNQAQRLYSAQPVLDMPMNPGGYAPPVANGTSAYNGNAFGRQYQDQYGDPFGQAVRQAAQQPNQPARPGDLMMTFLEALLDRGMTPQQNYQQGQAMRQSINRAPRQQMTQSTTRGPRTGY